MGKNGILKNKAGEQIFPATTADQVAWDKTTNLKQAMAKQDARISNLAKLPSGSTTGDAELQDIRTGEDGTVYDNAGEAVRQQIGSLKEDLGSIIIENESKNILSSLNFIKGKYISVSTGKYMDNENYATSDFIKVKENTNYILSSFNDNVFDAEIKCIFVFFDASKKFINGLDTNKVTTPNNCRYIRFCPHVSKLNKQLMLEEGTESSKTYIEYFKNVYINADKIERINYITVDTNGDGDYTKIQDAIESIKNESRRNKYIIYIKEGEYDLAEGITDGENDASIVGVTVPNWTTLKGVGDRKNIILRAKFNNKMQYVSALNFKETGGIENLTVIGENTRYTIHDDDARNANGYERNVKHCIIKGLSTYYSVVYGSGSGDGAKWDFEDVVFDGTETGANKKSGNTFTVHNLLSSKQNRNISFKNCIFKSANEGNVKFKTLAYRTATGKDDARNMVTNVALYGCKFEGVTKGLELVEENPDVYGKGCYYYVNGFGNINAGYEIITTDDKDYSDRVNLI